MALKNVISIALTKNNILKMKSIYILWFGAFTAIVGLLLSVFLEHSNTFYAIIIVGILVQVYAIYMMNRE